MEEDAEENIVTQSDIAIPVVLIKKSHQRASQIEIDISDTLASIFGNVE